MLELDENKTEIFCNYISSKKEDSSINPEALEELSGTLQAVEQRQNPINMLNNMIYGETTPLPTISIDIDKSQTESGKPIFSDKNNKDMPLWHHLVADFDKDSIDKSGEDLAIMLIRERQENPDSVDLDKTTTYNTSKDNGKLLDPLSVLAVKDDSGRVLQEALNHGANPNESQALQSVYSNHSHDAVRMLLEAGAEPKVVREEDNPLDKTIERVNKLKSNINLDIEGKVLKQETLTDAAEEKKAPKSRIRKFLQRRKAQQEKPSIVTDDNKVVANELVENKQFNNKIANSLTKDGELDMYKVFAAQIGQMGNEAIKKGDKERQEKLGQVVDSVLESLSDDVFKDKKQTLISTLNSVARQQKMGGNDFLENYNEKRIEAEQNRSENKSQDVLKGWSSDTSIYKPPPTRQDRLQKKLDQAKERFKDVRSRNKTSSNHADEPKQSWEDKVTGRDQGGHSK